jgi:hypothetical protein
VLVVPASAELRVQAADPLDPQAEPGPVVPPEAAARVDMVLHRGPVARLDRVVMVDLEERAPGLRPRRESAAARVDTVLLRGPLARLDRVVPEDLEARASGLRPGRESAAAQERVSVAMLVRG